MKNYQHPDSFQERHIGINENDKIKILKTLNLNSIDELIEQTIPQNIRLNEELNLPDEISEEEFLRYAKSKAEKNKVAKSYIGLGYYPTITPPVILRNIFENPGWYTQYTPYQAEISQGRLEALMNYQTMIIDLTGLPIANASLLDEGTAAAEAMILLFNHGRSGKNNAATFLVDINLFPQTIAVLKTRAKFLGINLKVVNVTKEEITDDVFGFILQYPNQFGEINDYSELFLFAKEKNVHSVVAADLLSLTLIKSPGELGADIAVGNTQRFGVPMGYGGPHAAYFAAKDDFKRVIPGRIIGASIDAEGNTAFRMALQTREQHIRREKATSNICTAQVLLAIMAGFYAVYHGPKRLKAIGERVHNFTKILEHGLIEKGFKQLNKFYFDTLRIECENSSVCDSIIEESKNRLVNFRRINDVEIGISLHEAITEKDILEILNIFSNNSYSSIDDIYKNVNIESRLNHSLIRSSNYLTHPVFNSYHSETEMLRYLKRLENKDLSLTLSMIPLGSCTMKLNAASEMIPVSFEGFSNIHPYAPEDQTEGYKEVIDELGKSLIEITGFDAVSFQPNSGAQGEYSGLIVIREYQKSIGEERRNIVLIPSSAHGTNPASAVMAGMNVVVVNCDSFGNIDVADLKSKAEKYKENLSALMVTYPSTHGVFEEQIVEICEIIHTNGGQVYMDGANMNAQVGLTSPAKIGADVCHLNLHKTFAIPHGGGGPGMGPIAVKKHLIPFLPVNPFINDHNKDLGLAVSSAMYGSASILIISLGYIKMLGKKGLTEASKYSILNANYLAERLKKYYKILFVGKNDRVAHELIFDFREFKKTANLEVEDVAKRLMDYGFHAPTVSFPVAGTLMVEPTESESLFELDRFCDAMISIRKEIEDIENGIHDKIDNPLKNAPHTLHQIANDIWNHKYSREVAVFPNEWVKKNKFWPSVARVNNAYGDRNLVCSCLPISEYENVN